MGPLIFECLRPSRENISSCNEEFNSKNVFVIIAADQNLIGPVYTSTAVPPPPPPTASTAGPQVSTTAALSEGDFQTVVEGVSHQANATLAPPLVENTPCDCPRIVISSQNPNTIEKHGNQLGSYRLFPAHVSKRRHGLKKINTV